MLLRTDSVSPHTLPPVQEFEGHRLESSGSPSPHPDTGRPLRVSEVLSALTYALDLTEGQPLGHTVRSCVIGMAIGRQIGLAPRQLSDLYYALLMKDAGCSTNASRMYRMLGSDEIIAKRDVKTTDWTRLGWESLEYALGHVKPEAPFLERVRALVSMAMHQESNARELVKVRCERGASIARRLGLSETTAEAIHSLDELWNGRGQPEGLRGESIPLLSRILNISQCVEVFFTHRSKEAALHIAAQRSGRWFDPDLVAAFQSVVARPGFWEDVNAAPVNVMALEPVAETFAATEDTIDRICIAFADIVDAKSPFTYRHSTGVAGAAVAIGNTLGLGERELTFLQRAALLHDIGKLGVSNAILDKPDKLTAAEWEKVKPHPRYSGEILRRIPGFDQIARVAASHHEKLDGSGYVLGLSREQMNLPSRILVVADIYDALAAKRPYRDAMPQEKVFGILQDQVPHALDADCLEALRQSTELAHSMRTSLLQLSLNVEDHDELRESAEISRPA